VDLTTPDQDLAPLACAHAQTTCAQVHSYIKRIVRVKSIRRYYACTKRTLDWLGIDVQSTWIWMNDPRWTPLLVSVRVCSKGVRSSANLHQKNRQNQLYKICHARSMRTLGWLSIDAQVAWVWVDHSKRPLFLFPCASAQTTCAHLQTYIKRIARISSITYPMRARSAWCAR
jgi:hypothetical protein